MTDAPFCGELVPNTGIGVLSKTILALSVVRLKEQKPVFVLIDNCWEYRSTASLNMGSEFRVEERSFLGSCIRQNKPAGQTRPNVACWIAFKRACIRSGSQGGPVTCDLVLSVGLSSARHARDLGKHGPVIRVSHAMPLPCERVIPNFH